jgi:hypothetical protein
MEVAVRLFGKMQYIVHRTTPSLHDGARDGLLMGGVGAACYAIDSRTTNGYLAWLLCSWRSFIVWLVRASRMKSDTLMDACWPAFILRTALATTSPSTFTLLLNLYSFRLLSTWLIGLALKHISLICKDSQALVVRSLRLSLCWTQLLLALCVLAGGSYVIT